MRRKKYCGFDEREHLSGWNSFSSSPQAAAGPKKGDQRKVINQAASRCFDKGQGRNRCLHRKRIYPDERRKVSQAVPYHSIMVEHGRSLNGVFQDQSNITKGILVTSGEFSEDCKEFVRDKRIELFNRDNLYGLLKKYVLPF